MKHPVRPMAKTCERHIGFTELEGIKTKSDLLPHNLIPERIYLLVIVSPIWLNYLIYLVLKAENNFV